MPVSHGGHLCQSHTEASLTQRPSVPVSHRGPDRLCQSHTEAICASLTRRPRLLITGDECWTYWKHFGGLKSSDAKQEYERPPPTGRLERSAQVTDTAPSLCFIGCNLLPPVYEYVDGMLPIIIARETCLWLQGCVQIIEELLITFFYQGANDSAII